MAKLILLEIADDDDAEQLTKALENKAEIDERTFDVTVRGVYKWPARYCECDEETRDKSQTSVRGQKYGWWVKRCCGLPEKGGAQTPINELERDLVKSFGGAYRNYGVTGWPFLGRDA